MRKALSVALAVLAVPGMALAQLGDSTWLGKTTIDAGNLDVAAQAFRVGTPMVRLQNRSGKPAVCSATFSHEPQFSETRSATIAPGKNATIGYGVHYNTATVNIDVRCRERTT